MAQQFFRKIFHGPSHQFQFLIQGSLVVFHGSTHSNIQISNP